MAYRIAFAPRAADEIAELPRKIQRQVLRRVEFLAEAPRPRQSRKLEGVEHLYRIRSGDFRILYQVHDDVVLVLVVRVGHRREVYRRLPAEQPPPDDSNEE